MELAETYKAVSRSIVAIAVKPQPNQSWPGVPTIMGTGFVVEDGLIATNDHVVRQAERLQEVAGTTDDEWPIIACLFYLLPNGMCQIPMEVMGAFTVGKFETKGIYYGPKVPDLGFLHVKMKGLPTLEPATELQTVEPGIRIATAGFPMGTDALRAPGYIHQLTPTLQEGIVSAVLPFSGKAPHAFMLNLMCQGGASGSPIFLPHTPQVIGVLYAGLTEQYWLSIQGVRVPYSVPTNFTYCVPTHLLRKAIENIRSKPELALPADSPTFQDAITRASEFNVENPGPQGSRDS